ncbi:hypothetical protein ACFP3Q_12500 [Nocardioides sp. GCM10027113]|uniref:hypothetical protein n=1 Tax=unclassified Nocardioides TaxID=2615069 RepID=UPI0036210D80
MPETPPPTDEPGKRRLFLHLGLQKTGTSYLQGVMRANLDRLAGQGLDVVPADRRDTFELMLLVRERYDEQRDPASVATALDRFRDELDRAPGSRALLSQESLAAARPAQIARLLEACADREVHVVLTVRDLGRQLPSSWQQELKAGRTDGYRRYLQRLQASQEAGETSHPWIHLDPPAVLARWAGLLPADRIHVVTVPPSGSAPTLLLERFCRVLDVDPEGLVPEERPANTSLGRVQAEVLRRVNKELPDELRRRQVYGDVGKRFFSSQVLSAQDGRRIRVPAEFREWCERVADEQVATLGAAGYRVEGTLEDLRCLPSAFSDDEARPGEAEVAAAAVSALVRILTMRAEDQRRRRGRHGHADGTGQTRLPARLWDRVRRRPARGAEAPES